MNKYKIYNSTNAIHIPAGCDGSYEIEAEYIKVNEMGQVCFYFLAEMENGIIEDELIAVFPAGVAVIKLHEGSAEIYTTQKHFDKGDEEYLRERLKEKHGGVSEVIEVPAGSANTVFNEPIL